MGRLFGTDGVRGLANEALSVELALSISIAAAQVLAGDRNWQDRSVAVVGRDPRASGEMLEAAVIAGLTASGVDVLSVGVLPTPAVAYLTGHYGAVMGVMISASHNPMDDNGIKIFAAMGQKLEDSVEDEIEAVMESGESYRPIGADIGRTYHVTDALGTYLAHLATSINHRLDGLKVVLDCANGAAFEASPAAFRAAGAEVITINAEPDGININANCGSTHMESLRAAVVEHGAALGIAHDGDADRCLAVDANGDVVDGDAIMAILALGMHAEGELVDGVLVAPS